MKQTGVECRKRHNEKDHPCKQGCTQTVTECSMQITPIKNNCAPLLEPFPAFFSAPDCAQESRENGCQWLGLDIAFKQSSQGQRLLSSDSFICGHTPIHIIVCCNNLPNPTTTDDGAYPQLGERVKKEEKNRTSKQKMCHERRRQLIKFRAKKLAPRRAKCKCCRKQEPRAERTDGTFPDTPHVAHTLLGR